MSNKEYFDEVFRVVSSLKDVTSVLFASYDPNRKGVLCFDENTYIAVSIRSSFIELESLTRLNTSLRVDINSSSSGIVLHLYHPDYPAF